MSHSIFRDPISDPVEGDPATPEPDRHRLTLVRIGEHFFGIGLASISEVVVPREIVRLPGASMPVVGLANVKGRIVTIVDLAHALGLEHGEAWNPRLVVLAQGRAQSALLVPEVAGIHEAVLGGEFGSAPSSDLTAGEFEAGGRAGRLLNPERVLDRYFR